MPTKYALFKQYFKVFHIQLENVPQEKSERFFSICGFSTCWWWRLNLRWKGNPLNAARWHRRDEKEEEFGDTNEDRDDVYEDYDDVRNDYDFDISIRP